MKVSKIIFFISLLILLQFFSCKPKVSYGNLKGNVFWKYNKFVGNKPDAGSKVIVIPLNTKDTTKYNTLANVKGDFNFDKIKSGKYLLIVSSKNTTPCPKEYINVLKNNKTYLKNIWNFNYDKYKQGFEKILNIEKTKDSLMLASYKTQDTKKVISITQKYTNLINESGKKELELMKRMKNEPFFKKTKLFPFSKKLFIKEIEINKELNPNIIIDFGITCD